MKIIEVKVKPNARRRALAQDSDVWRAHLTSPPVEGKANAELIALVAAHFGVRKSAVSIRRGANGRVKWVQIDTV